MQPVKQHLRVAVTLNGFECVVILADNLDGQTK